MSNITTKFLTTANSGNTGTPVDIGTLFNVSTPITYSFGVNSSSSTSGNITWSPLPPTGTPPDDMPANAMSSSSQSFTFDNTTNVVSGIYAVNLNPVYYSESSTSPSTFIITLNGITFITYGINGGNTYTNQVYSGIITISSPPVISGTIIATVNPGPRLTGFSVKLIRISNIPA